MIEPQDHSLASEENTHTNNQNTKNTKGHVEELSLGTKNFIGSIFSMCLYILYVYLFFVCIFLVVQKQWNPTQSHILFLTLFGATL